MTRSHEPTATQREVLDRGLLTSGFNCILQMPTGAGKTWLAERAISETLARGRRAIYLAPLRALASELVERWRTEFAPHEVGVFTGEYGTRRPFPVPFDRARLAIMTPERLDQTTRLQLRQRLSHDGATHAPCAHEFGLGRQFVAGTELPVADLSRDPLDEIVRQAAPPPTKGLG